MTDQRPPIQLVSVVIPVYNEVERIERAVAAVEAVGLPDGLAREIVLVDDGSTDGTMPILQRLAAEREDRRLIRHERNRGKGAALRTGFRAARGDVLIIHDADLEYDPQDHLIALAPIIDGRADVVIGSRFLGQTHRVLYYWHSVMNRLITTCSNMLTNLNLTDIECCTKALHRSVADRIEIQEPRFGVEPELVAKVARLTRTEAGNRGSRGERGSRGGLGSGGPLRIYEVPVSYAGRTYAEGKKITWRDGVSALRCIVRYGLGPHREPGAEGTEGGSATEGGQG